MKCSLLCYTWFQRKDLKEVRNLGNNYFYQNMRNFKEIIDFFVKPYKNHKHTVVDSCFIKLEANVQEILRVGRRKLEEERSNIYDKMLDITYIPPQVDPYSHSSTQSNIIQDDPSLKTITQQNVQGCSLHKQLKSCPMS